MSDIVGDPMSPNDPIDDMFDLADAEIRVVQVTEILADLIAELRDEHANGDGYCGAALEAADRAEARLREVSGE